MERSLEQKRNQGNAREKAKIAKIDVDDLAHFLFSYSRLITCRRKGQVTEARSVTIYNSSLETSLSETQPTRRDNVSLSPLSANSHR